MLGCHTHTHTLCRDRQSSNNVDVANGNLLDELSVLGEDLHAWALAAAITDHILTRRADHSYLPRVPQLTFFTTYTVAQKVWLFWPLTSCIISVNWRSVKSVSLFIYLLPYFLVSFCFSDIILTLFMLLSIAAVGALSSHLETQPTVTELQDDG